MPRRRASRLLEENKKIGEQKRWKGGRELWQWGEGLEFGKIAQQGRSQETPQETGQEKRRSGKERSRKTIPGKNILFNDRQEGGKKGNDQERRRDKGKLFSKVKEKSLRMIHLKKPRKFLSSILQKRQQENVERRNKTNAKSRKKEKIREKIGRKLFFRGLGVERPHEKRDQGGGQPAVKSDEQTIISVKKAKKRPKNPKIEAIKRASLSGKVMTNKNFGRKVSLDKNVDMIRKGADSDKKEDFALRMDFVDCKCKFGKNLLLMMIISKVNNKNDGHNE